MLKKLEGTVLSFRFYEFSSEKWPFEKHYWLRSCRQ